MAQIKQLRADYIYIFNGVTRKVVTDLLTSARKVVTGALRLAYVLRADRNIGTRA